MNGVKIMDEVVKILTAKHKTIATMESCTGGGFVNAITNIEGASEVLKFSAITYSNEYKIRMGVSSKILKKYSVYSIETAMEMSANIAKFANADYGIGITGKLNKIDKNNLMGSDNQIFVCIYDKEKCVYYNFDLIVDQKSRKENKEEIINNIVAKLLAILRNSD